MVPEDGWRSRTVSDEFRGMLRVISACVISSCQKLMGNEGCVPASIVMKCRLKVCIARSALLARLLKGGTHWYVM
jgi:hypothetical protein